MSYTLIIFWLVNNVPNFYQVTKIQGLTECRDAGTSIELLLRRSNLPSDRKDESIGWRCIETN